MKPLYFFAFIVLLQSCKHRGGETIVRSLHDTNAVIKENEILNDTQVSIITSDTVVIPFQDDDTLFYTQAEIDSIKKYYPEINAGLFNTPDNAYAIYSRERGGMEHEQQRKIYSFESEAGQDEYYMLYAYFLKNKDGIKKYNARRSNTIKILRLINNLNGILNNGGTYFGHQYKRIEAYAEYGIGLYSNEYSREFFTKDYSITSQKILFIKSLKQGIIDEITSDRGMSPLEKKQKMDELFLVIDKLNGLLTDYFYLQQARQFEYSYY